MPSQKSKYVPIIPSGITTPIGPLASTAIPMPAYIPIQASIGNPCS